MKRKRPVLKSKKAKKKAASGVRTVSTEEAGIFIRKWLMSIWDSAHFDQTARIELLRTAIFACDMLNGFSEDDFKEIAPFARGWPVVLAATKERARDREKAKASITRLQAGTKHRSRFRLESVGGEFACFVDTWFQLAILERDNLKFNEPGSGKVTAEDVKGLAKSAENVLAKTYGNDWQDSPSVSKVFGNGLYTWPTTHERKPWKDFGRWQKRQIVRDKLRGGEQTYTRQLKRFGVIQLGIIRTQKHLAKRLSGRSGSGISSEVEKKISISEKPKSELK